MIKFNILFYIKKNTYSYISKETKVKNIYKSNNFMKLKCVHFVSYKNLKKFQATF